MPDIPIQCRLFEPTDYWKSEVPEGVSGECRIERFTLDPLTLDEASEENVPYWRMHRPGEYTRLMIGSVEMMTDLYEEWWSQREAISEALKRGGNVLVSGLGLGMFIECLLRPEDSPVKHVTVLEYSADVINLTGPLMRERYGDRLEIVNCSSFEYNPPEGIRYSVVWHDIWADPTAEYHAEVLELEKRYAPYADWQQTWTTESFTGENSKADPESFPVTLRPIQLIEGDTDLPFLRELYASTRRDEMQQTGWPKVQIEDFLRQQFEAQHKFYMEQFNGADFNLILGEDGEPIGRLYVEERDDEFRIIDIALLPQHRGNGIGSRLLRDIIGKASAAGKTVRIHVEHNNPAMHLYNRLGFQMVEEQGVYHLMEFSPADKREEESAA